MENMKECLYLNQAGTYQDRKNLHGRDKSLCGGFSAFSAIFKTVAILLTILCFTVDLFANPTKGGGVYSGKMLTGLAISGASKVDVNKTITLTATAKLNNAINMTVSPSWSSSNTAVATVSSSGVVTGKKSGSVTITATYTYSGVTENASKTITVFSRQVTKLTVSGSTSLSVGKTTRLTAAATFNDGTSSLVTPSWSSSNTAVATVSSSGVVSGKKAGTTTVTARYTYSGVTKSVSKTITVAGRKLTGLTVSGDSKVDVNKTITLTATATYDNGTSNQVTPSWSSSNASAASVSSSGVVSGKKNGTATVTATYTYYGVTKQVKKTIKVGRKLTGLTISGSSKINVGEKTTLTVTATYDNGTSNQVTPSWSSSNAGAASVSSSGVVRGKKSGSTTITATYTYYGVTKRVSKTIAVCKQLTGLFVSGSSSVGVNGTTKFTATATFNDGSSSPVNPTWSSSYSSVASVSSYGVVSGRRTGSATITATFTFSGVTRSASRTVTVTNQLSSLSIASSSSVKVGNSITMFATAYFTNGDSYRVYPTWSSSNSSVASVSSYGNVTGRKAGTVTITARYTYSGVTRTASRTISVTSSTIGGGGGGGGGGGASISGPSTLKYMSSGTYYLYVGGKKVTSSSVAWSRSGKCTMSDKGSYGLLKATSKPTVSKEKVTVIAQYNGKRYTKSVTITR